MAFVWVRVKPQYWRASRAMMERFLEKLPTIVAGALSVPNTEGELTSDEIRVKFETFGPSDIYIKDIEITIWANECWGRKRNLDERQELITKEVKRIVHPGTTCFVQVFLQPGSSGEF